MSITIRICYVQRVDAIGFRPSAVPPQLMTPPFLIPTEIPRISNRMYSATCSIVIVRSRRRDPRSRSRVTTDELFNAFSIRRSNVNPAHREPRGTAEFAISLPFPLPFRPGSSKMRQRVRSAGSDPQIASETKRRLNQKRVVALEKGRVIKSTVCAAA